MDYALYHRINVFVEHHAWLGSGAAALERWAVPALAIATVALWLAARPGGSRKWKRACASALGGTGLALLVNQAVARVWHRARPYSVHPSAHVWGARSHDASFPSDHASAAFAIAFVVLLYDRLVGGVFLASATAIGAGRVVAGVHYPADVGAGVLVGLGSALVVGRLARPLVELAVRLVERATDPILGLFWSRPAAR